MSPVRLRHQTHPASVMLAAALFRHVYPRVHGRGSWRLNRLRWFASRRVLVSLAGTVHTFDAFDPYWAPYIYRHQDYEPEVSRALHHLGRLGQAHFLDCGANFGYWSTQVASGKYGQHRVTAIEASSETYSRLVRNVPDSVETVHAAVSDTLGWANFDDGLPHAGRALSHSGSSRVRTTTIDALAQASRRLIIKLDVEGAEQLALAGASTTLSGDVAFIYEDHGSDDLCSASDAMLKAGLDVFALDEGVAPVTDLRAIRSRKVDRSIGYNFVACNGAFAQALSQLPH